MKVNQIETVLKGPKRSSELGHEGSELASTDEIYSQAIS